jgi:phosphate starvation-inducible PhoH-like protein
LLPRGEPAGVTRFGPAFRFQSSGGFAYDDSRQPEVPTAISSSRSQAISERPAEDALELHFDDSRLITDLLGQHDAHIRTLEQALGVRIDVNGTAMRIAGPHAEQALAGKVLGELYELLKRGYPVFPSDVEYSVRILRGDRNAELKDIFLDTIYVSAHKRVISPKSINQKLYIDAIRSHDIVFGIGPAGTGKTYLAMAMALAALMKNQVTRMVLCRPAVEAGEKLGFLPGDLAEKVNPYLRPLYDALHDMVDFDRARRMLERGTIEVAPLAFMRGRTLNDSFIILDEAQNTTSEQMKMFLTRLGYNSKAVITGDITQIDLPSGKLSGLKEARTVLANTEGIKFVYFTDRDVVRHRLVSAVIAAYESFQREGVVQPGDGSGNS